MSADIVIFTVRQDAVQVLLRQRYSETLDKTYWALPGGYIRPAEPLEDCARRTLAQQTGIGDVYLEQLYTFGRPDRHPRSRVITVSYIALMPGERASDTMDSPNIAWHPIDKIPELYLDHADIIELGRKRLVAKIGYSAAAFQLVPAYFTLGELQNVYEITVGERVDKRNFRKKILAMDHVEHTGKFSKNRSHRPARLYRYTGPRNA